jgi:dTDP-4-amino-4,6-dideoxygalactose transaminase
MANAAIKVTEVRIGDEEKQAVLRVLDSGQLAQGPVVAELERQFAELCGVPHAVAVSNGTVALVAVLEALGLGPGDEVITTPFSFAATLNAILESGATARFADIRDDFTLDPDAAGALVNERTRAILPVHLYGLPADLTALSALAGGAGLHLVEDSAQAHGAAVGDRAAGSFGTGTFSLYATKNVQCGEGGLITTSDDALAERLRLLRNQGSRTPYRYEVPGHNWRLTDLQAAIALPQLSRLAETNGRRRAHAHRLSEGLAGLPGLITPVEVPGRRHVWHQYTVRVTDEAPLTRDALAASLRDAGIGCGLYYPALMYDYDCYAGHPGIVADPTPLAARITGQVLSLPVHQHLCDADLDRIIEAVRRAFNA